MQKYVQLVPPPNLPPPLIGRIVALPTAGTARYDFCTNSRIVAQDKILYTAYNLTNLEPEEIDLNEFPSRHLAERSLLPQCNTSIAGTSITLSISGIFVIFYLGNRRSFDIRCDIP